MWHRSIVQKNRRPEIFFQVPESQYPNTRSSSSVNTLKWFCETQGLAPNLKEFKGILANY